MLCHRGPGFIFKHHQAAFSFSGWRHLQAPGTLVAFWGVTPLARCSSLVEASFVLCPFLGPQDKGVGVPSGGLGDGKEKGLHHGWPSDPAVVTAARWNGWACRKASCGGWAHSRVLAGCSCNTALMVSWKGALEYCSGAKGAMLEVDPLQLVLLDLWVDPPPWAPHHQWHEQWPLLLCGWWCPCWHCLLQSPVCLLMQKWAATCLAAVDLFVSIICGIQGPWRSANCGPASWIPVFIYRVQNKRRWSDSWYQEATVMVMHVAKHDSSGSWGCWGLKNALVGEGGGSGLGACSWGPISWGLLPCAILLPLGHRACLPPPLVCSSPFLIPCLGMRWYLNEVMATTFQESRGFSVTPHRPGSLQVAQSPVIESSWGKARCLGIPPVGEGDTAGLRRVPRKDMLIGFVSLPVSLLVCRVLLETGGLRLRAVVEIWVQCVSSGCGKSLCIFCSISFPLILNHGSLLHEVSLKLH